MARTSHLLRLPNDFYSEESVGRLMLDEHSALINEARNNANLILEAARIEAEEIRHKAHNEGFTRGYQEGLEVARQEAEFLKANAKEILRQAEESRKDKLSALEKEIISLAKEIAEKIVLAQLEVDSRVVLRIAEEALQLLRNRKQVNIFVHPSEVELFKMEKERLSTILSKQALLQVFADQEIQPGGCRIETDEGIIDATLETRWSVVERALQE